MSYPKFTKSHERLLNAFVEKGKLHHKEMCEIISNEPMCDSKYYGSTIDRRSSVGALVINNHFRDYGYPARIVSVRSYGYELSINCPVKMCKDASYN